MAFFAGGNATVSCRTALSDFKSLLAAFRLLPHLIVM